MAMSFHLLVRSSGPLRAQGGSPLQRAEQEFARELAQPGPRLLCFSIRPVARSDTLFGAADLPCPVIKDFRKQVLAILDVR